MSPDGTTEMSQNTGFSRKGLQAPVLKDDGSNWVVYKQYMEHYIIGYDTGYRRHLRGRAHEPQLPKKNKDGTIDMDEEEEYENAMDEYERAQSSIIAIILSSISEHMRNRLLSRSPKKAHEMWDKTCSTYEKQSVLIKADLKFQIYSITCSEDGDPLKTMDELLIKFNEYASAGGIMEDDDQAAILIKAMPHKYHPTIQTVIAAAAENNTPIRLENLLARLTEAIKLDQGKQKRAKEDEVAMAARFKDWKVKRNINTKGKSKEPKETSQDSSDDQENIECYNCGGKGHYSRNCSSKRKKKSKAKSDKANQKTHAKKAEKKSGSEGGKADESNESTDFGLSAANLALGLKAVNEGSIIRLLDSAASQHFDPDRRNFTDMRRCDPFPIEVATGHIVYANEIGTVRFACNQDGITKTFKLQNVYYTPDIPSPLISVACLRRNGLTFSNARQGVAELIDENGKTILQVPEIHNVYPLTTWVPNLAKLAAHTRKMTLMEAHYALGHVAVETIKAAIEKKMFTGLNVDLDSQIEDCEACIKGRMKRKSISKYSSKPKTKVMGEIVYADTWGPAQIQGVGKYNYFVLFIDDFSRYTRLYLLKTKESTEVLDKFKSYESELKTQFNASVKCLHSDRGGEFLNMEFGQYLRIKGIRHQLTTHDTPEHNGIAERANYTIVDLARVMHADSGLPKKLWPYSVSYSVWIKNRMPTKALKYRKKDTPYEAVFESKPDMSKAKQWGCRIIVKLKKTPASKLNERGEEARWIGPSINTVDGQIVYWPNSGKVTVERDIYYLEKSMLEGENIDPTDELEVNVEYTTPYPDKSKSSSYPTPGQITRNDPITFIEGIREKAAEEEMTDRGNEELRRSTRAKKPSEYVRRVTAGESADGLPPGMRYYSGTGNANINGIAKAAIVKGIPRNIWEAKRSEEWSQWEEAMKAEIIKIKQKRTYDLVDRRNAKIKPIPLQWVFDYKINTEGNVIGHKARIVAGGDKQQYLVNFDQTASPVM